MKNQHEPLPGSEDDLRAENEVLKLKLEMEYGMKGHCSMLDPKMENQWLKSVYDFEVMLSLARESTIFDLIGRPVIQPWHTLNKRNVTVELHKILGLLKENGMSPQGLGNPDELTFYRVITEELLPMKFGELKNGPLMPPMITWFGK